MIFFLFIYMRERTLIFIVFMVISPIILCSKSIKILYPNGGEVLHTNTSVFIKWTSEDTAGKVIIALYDKGIKCFTISEGTENTGTFLWKIPQNFKEGKNYRLRIRRLDDLSINDFSDGDFTITKKNQKK